VFCFLVGLILLILLPAEISVELNAGDIICFHKNAGGSGREQNVVGISSRENRLNEATPRPLE